jgi:predicted nucleotidyltransferase
VALARLRGTLVERLSILLSSHAGVRGAWLFGSAARGDGGRRSDIDILLVHVPAGPPDADDLGSWLAAECEAWTGNPVQVVEHSPDAFARLVGDKNPLIAAIGRDGIALTPTSRALLAMVTA